MSIIWKYLDKRSAAIAAIKDFDSMEFIIKTSEREIERANEKLTSAGPKLSDIPSVHDPKATEKKILAVVDEINILQERYQQALEYMAWFKPAWAQLAEQDQYILKTFYSEQNGYGCNAVYEIADKMKVEPPTVYKQKNRALNRLVILLFGKG